MIIFVDNLHFLAYNIKKANGECIMESKNNKTFNGTKNEDASSDISVCTIVFRLKDKNPNNYRKLPQKKLQIFLTKSQHSAKSFCLPTAKFNFSNSTRERAIQFASENFGLKICNTEELCTITDNWTLVDCFVMLTNQSQTLENGDWFDVDIMQNSNKLQTENGFSVFQNETITLSNLYVKLQNTLDIYIDRQGLIEQKKVIAQQTPLSDWQVKVLQFAIEKLKMDLLSTNKIFFLLDEKFTLTELKNSFECILDKKFLDANFRRKISRMVLPIQEYSNGGGHRSSQYFKFNPLFSFHDFE